MSQDEALDLALEFFETMQRYKGVRSNIFIKFEPTATGDYFNLQEFDERAKPIITAIKQARSAPVQEPVAYWIPKAEQFCIADSSGRPFAKAWEPLYTTPPAAQRQWVPVTKELLAAQHSWLYEPMWIAMKDGSVMTGHYQWMQGRYPDRFIVGDCASLWAFEASHVMPLVSPEHPNTKLKEKQS